jgi:hypothetical protein
VLFCQNIQTTKKEASRQTHTQETTELRKKNTNRNMQRDHVRKKPSEADSFIHMEIKIYYTPEDGHVGQNM